SGGKVAISVDRGCSRLLPLEEGQPRSLGALALHQQVTKRSFDATDNPAILKPRLHACHLVGLQPTLEDPFAGGDRCPMRGFHLSAFLGGRITRVDYRRTQLERLNRFVPFPDHWNGLCLFLKSANGLECRA